MSPSTFFLTLLGSTTALASLWVDTPPDSPKPYAMKHNAPAKAVAVGAQIYRFPVTGPSSGGKFSLLWTSAPASGALGVLPHTHHQYYENFFCMGGRYQLWTEKYGDKQGRLLTPGDYGAVPPNTTHTFQLLDPMTELLGAIAPGGFEDLFFQIANSNYSAPTLSPYVPSASNNSAGAGSSAGMISALEALDVFAQLDFSPRRDFVNGSAPASEWHVSENIVPSNFTPFYIAKDYGPKYLHSGAHYQIVQPFLTPSQTKSFEFTEGTITLSPLAPGANASAITPSGAMAFQVIEGELTVEMEGETLRLINGDVVFVPENTAFTYFSSAAFTKVLYLCSGNSTLDTQLIANATSWDYPTWPTSFPKF